MANMKFTFLALLFYCGLAMGQTSKDIVIGKRDTLYSHILKENRELWVSVPPLENPDIRSATYPVLYLLDGDRLFLQTAGILDHLSGPYSGERCPKMIIVGIVHSNRMKDLLPITKDGALETCDDFTAFLEKELIPYIDRTYPTQPYRTLLGHSLGGLRVANTLLSQPQIFNSYIALDPSAGHDMGVWSERSSKLIPQKKLAAKSFFLEMAHTMPKGMDTSAIFRDTSGAARHMRCIMKLAKTLRAHPQTGLRFNWTYNPDLTHGDVTFDGTFDGLKDIFSWYPNPDGRKIYDAKVSTEQALAIIEKKYQEISTQMGYTVLPSEQFVMEIVGQLLNRGQTEKAKAFARLNIRNYPQSELAKFYLKEIGE
jgi:predicted alpha/beta superfamily hydrolase